MIKAVAFDIDGTLYNQFSFSVRCVPFVMKHLRFMLGFARVRKELHRNAAAGKAYENFFETQAKMLADKLNSNPQQVNDFIEKEIYTGWRKLFAKVKPYPFAFETIAALKTAGYKIALMSDFPPTQKNDVWGIAALCDAVVSSEAAGTLKPHIKPFTELAEKLQILPAEILYVGNSLRYDVAGAKRAGMKTALICNAVKKRFSQKKADIVFSDYRELGAALKVMR